MDLVLRKADDYFLDALWMRLAPYTTALGALASTPETAALVTNSSSGPAPDRALAFSSYSSNFELAWFAFKTSSVSASPWPRDHIGRQLVSLSLITYVGIFVMYFLIASFSYYFLFDHRLKRHPKFKPNQIRREIGESLQSFPPVIVLTLPWFLAEVNGYSKLYDDVAEHGWGYLVFSIALTLLFTDQTIYYIHLAMHHPLLYKRIHKQHHQFTVPTPFASHAFHPIDGYLTSLPYHAFIFFFPFHRKLYIGLFIFVNVWTVMIHDSDMFTINPVINGPSHHTVHHLHLTVNYGQYFTFADRLAGSYRHPTVDMDPLLDVPKDEKTE